MPGSLLILPSIILGSKSPRRQELLQQMGVTFRIVSKDTDESYNPSLANEAIALQIAGAKMAAFANEFPNEIVITADTIVAAHGSIMGKPADDADAVRMLRALSGAIHEVITAVCIRFKQSEFTFTDTTRVTFRSLTDPEIEHYVHCFKPLDKAGAYGIQEWIGLTAIEKIEGSYTNVVGLPTEKLYAYLKQLSF